MPLYTLECPECGVLGQHFMEMKDKYLWVHCDKCGEAMNRDENRAYYADVPQIRGDTCAGSCDMSNYFDDGLDTWVESRDHRSRIMAERGLTDYEPLSDMKKARTEGRYIMDHAPKGDKEALTAARKQSKDVDAVRKKRIIGAAVEKARKGMDKA